MAKVLSKQNVGANQVDGTKIQLLNLDPLRALSAGAVDTPLLELDAAGNTRILNPVNFNSQILTGLPNAINASDALPYAQAQTLIADYNSWKLKAATITSAPLAAYTYVAGTITATANGVLAAANGVSPVVGARWVINGEVGANAPYNGIYTIVSIGSVGSAYSMTRSTDANTAALLQGVTVSIDVGSTQAGVTYFENLAIAVLGVSNGGFMSEAAASLTFQNGTVLVGSTVSGVVDPAGGLSVGAAGFAVVTDGTSTSIVADVVKSVLRKTQNITLVAGDITNKYVDLAKPLSSVSAQGDTVLSVINGMLQEYSVDFTVAATGGAGGVARVSWSGLGLDGFLIATNEIQITYTTFN